MERLIKWHMGWKWASYRWEVRYIRGSHTPLFEPKTRILTSTQILIFFIGKNPIWKNQMVLEYCNQSLKEPHYILIRLLHLFCTENIEFYFSKWKNNSYWIWTFQNEPSLSKWGKTLETKNIKQTYVTYIYFYFIQ